MRGFRFGVVTDEIDRDLRRAATVAHELGMTDVELNMVGDKNAADLTPSEISVARAILDDLGLRVCAVGTMCFKAVALDEAAPHRLRGFPPLQEHLEILRRGLDVAHEFEASLVRVFSFRKAGMVGLGNPGPRLPDGGEIPLDDLHKIVEGLRFAGDLAQGTDVTLAVENVRSCWGNTGENVARICAAVDHPRVKILWDPGNSYVAGGVPYPNGYEAVRSDMVHVHVKDARVREAASGLTSWEAIGAGDVDYEPQIAALIRDGYAGVVSLETHWRGEGLTAEESSRRSFVGLLKTCASAG